MAICYHLRKRNRMSDEKIEGFVDGFMIGFCIGGIVMAIVVLIG